MTDREKLDEAMQRLQAAAAALAAASLKLAQLTQDTGKAFAEFLDLLSRAVTPGDTKE